MSKRESWVVGFPAWLWLAVLMAVISGCASKPRPDWNQRLGHYTFDQAVQELGPPFSSIRLQDGTTVAEWFLKAGPQFSFGIGTGFGVGPVGVGMGPGVTTAPKGHYLRLNFSPEGQLQRWEEVRR